MSSGEENNTDAGICHISQHYMYTIFSTFGAFWLPLTVIVIVYGRIFWIAQRRLCRRIRQRLTVIPPPMAVPISAACQSPSPTRRRRLPPNADQLSPEVADDGPRVGANDRSTPLVMLSVPGLQTTAAAATTTAADDAAAISPSSSGVAAAPKPETEFLQVQTTSRAVPSDVAAVSGVGAVGSTSTPSHGRSRVDVVGNHLVSYRKCQYKRMRNSARMLGLIIGAFVLCWLPFFLLATAVPFCADVCCVPGAVASVCNWLGYSNSLLNPVIYAIWDRNFRCCFRRLATCDTRSRSSGIAASAAARGMPGAALALRRSAPI